MSESIWTSLITQAPLVVAFIVYSLYITRAFMDAMDKRDAAFEKRNAAVVEAIQDLSKTICDKLDRAKPPARSKAKP